MVSQNEIAICHFPSYKGKLENVLNLVHTILPFGYISRKCCNGVNM